MQNCNKRTILQLNYTYYLKNIYLFLSWLHEIPVYLRCLLKFCFKYRNKWVCALRAMFTVYMPARWIKTGCVMNVFSQRNFFNLLNIFLNVWNDSQNTIIYLIKVFSLGKYKRREKIWKEERYYINWYLIFPKIAKKKKKKSWGEGIKDRQYGLWSCIDYKIFIMTIYIVFVKDMPKS